MKKLWLRVVCAVAVMLTLAAVITGCSEKPYDYKLENYVKISEKWKEIVVSEAEINEKRNELLSNALKNTAKQETVIGRGAEYGDRVRVSFTFYVYDSTKGSYVANPTFSDENCLIELGNGKYPSELEAALRGLRKDQPFEVSIMLSPDFAYPSLQGKPVKYVGEVLEVTAIVYGTLTDEAIKSISHCQTVEEYKNMLYDEAKKELYWEKLLGLTTVDAYPEAEMDKYTADYVDYYSDLADAEQMTLEEYVAKRFFMELRDFHVSAGVYAKELVKSEMVIYKMARDYGITLTSEEYNDGAYKYAKTYGLESVAKLEGKFGTHMVEQTVLMDKVMEFVVTEATRAATEQP